jgi:hypothetical protein
LVAPPDIALTTGTVTLLTGDRVVLASVGGRVIPRVDPGPGRDQIRFSIRTRGGHVTVIPEDVAAAIRDGRLDPALFDATRLLAEGDGDDRRSDLPLIITGESDLSPHLHAMATTGVTIARTLPALHAAIARQDKMSVGAVLSLIGGAGLAPRLAGTASIRIWLDGHRKVLLDQNVTQIGAPAAYARGLTGAGVTVAIVDTGIDAAHPDLAGKIIAAEDFVGDGNGTDDPFGHGTHVASIVAGTGAASSGEFQGVAPAATLINARVCDASGQCLDSDILAGMEWAAATLHAPIVNLSLGGTDTPDIDPLEDAVNRLSAEFGTLFVIAAGNEGLPLAIDSPGSADAALTVGAVDGNDELAGFSSTGPRLGDHAVKPDITAPGVAITAARAAGTALGPLVGDQYVTLSGTSMATPHVAGSAALLLEQHPDWSGAQLKAALMATAQPTADLNAYQQGAGRVDVDRATRQAITTEPPSMSFGIAAFPHEDDLPITRTVTYHNSGADPLVMTLAAALSNFAGPAPGGMVSISASTITVPAGGTTDVAITIDTRVGSDGVYSGDLVATSGDVRLVTPLGIEREAESYDLTLALIGADGQPANNVQLAIDSVGAPADPTLLVQLLLFGGQQTTFHLPAGTYEIGSMDFDSSTWLLAPRVALSADTTLTLDAHDARPADLTIPGVDARVVNGSWDYSDLGAGIESALVGGAFATAEIGASAAPGEIQSDANIVLATQGDRPSDVFFLTHFEDDHFPTGWRDTIRTDQMAVSTTSYAGPDNTLFQMTAVPLPTDRSAVGASFRFTGPVQHTEHFFAPTTQWWLDLFRNKTLPFFSLATKEDEIRELVVGQSSTETWNRAPFGPAFAGPSVFGAAPDGTAAPVRYGDSLRLVPGLYTSRDVPSRHGYTSVPDARLTLFRNGAQIAETTNPFLHLSPDVPPERAQYRLEGQLTLPATAVDLSPQVLASWTFSSQHNDSVEFLPLPTLRFSPELDEHNQTSARVLALPIRIERSAGAPRPRIARAEVEASLDDGGHWLPVPIVRVNDQALGLIIHPCGTHFVSLRGRTADVEGNQSDLTIIRAYAVVDR